MLNFEPKNILNSCAQIDLRTQSSRAADVLHNRSNGMQRVGLPVHVYSFSLHLSSLVDFSGQCFSSELKNRNFAFFLFLDAVIKLAKIQL